MSDTNEKNVLSLAITEKKPHRPGCVGIFFQLFDWNRRFAKKKLFSKKLLPPGRAKQASKKFGGDDKLPKLRLIADENSGGFPTVKKDGTRVVDSEQKHGMRPPSLIAKLMGLESMPAEKQDKLKKASSSRIIGVDRGEKFVTGHGVFGNEEDRSLEKRDTRHELRPQKLQKTGSYERRPVAKFGAEALQFKNVLSRSRKHHSKLASPVKSPKSLSGRNASRLIGAATKILEPGLQARYRAKCAITYAKAMHHVPVDEAMLSKSPNYYISESKSLKGQSSCRNCGHSLHMVDTRPNVEERPSVFSSSVSDYVSPSQGSERSKPKSPISSLEQEQERVLHKGQDQFTSLATRATENTKSPAEPISDRMPIDREGQIQWHSTSQHCKPQKDSTSSIHSSHKTQRQNQVSLGRDRVPPRSKLSNLQGDTDALSTNAINETKDFVALNRTLSGRTRSRMPAKMDNFKFDTYGKVGNRGDEFLSPVRKRRSMNVSRQSESCGFDSPTIDKHKNSNFNTMPRKEIGRNARSMNHRLAHFQESHMIGGSGKKDKDVISFTYSSPVKHKSGIPAGMEKRSDQNNSNCNKTPQKNSMSDEIERNSCFQKPFPLGGDTLGALLGQKLKELNFQEEDEFALGGTPPKRTSTIILQELISALTAERPYHQDAMAVGSNEENVSCYPRHMSNTKANITFQAKPKTAEASVRYAHDNDSLSPGSVLEASFSNDSCFSSSLDDNSVPGHKLCADSIDNSYNEPRLLERDSDILDSATTLSNGRTGKDFVTHLINQISEVLRVLDLSNAKSNGIKLAHAKEVILKAELEFRNAALHNTDRTQYFSLFRFLLDELETLASVMWTNFSCFLGFEDTKEGNLLKGFLFDCVVEYLESRYGQYSKFSSNMLTRLPLCVNNEMLIREVVGEVRRWAGLAGLVPDELIEREMSCCLGKWTNFDIEAFESGVEIDGDIFEGLVDEIVIELWECRVGFC